MAEGSATKPIARYAELFIEGLREAKINVVAALPDSKLASVFRACAAEPSIRYIPVSNEAELPGIVAGAYLGGGRALMVMENSGLRQCCEALTRFAYCHSMPMVMVMSLRGELGEPNWWGHNHAEVMEPLLQALRIPYFFVSRHAEIKPSIRKALVHTDASQWPVALIFREECLDGFQHEAH